MFPFWNLVIAPVLEAGGARRLVEIGALRGENTRQIIERLGPDTELHVIDPVPAFDPAEHEQEFAGQYVFHRDLSVNVLPELPAMDAALIDGDHNWYTVYNECRLLAESARRDGAELPIMILHDVLWPYGRRDLYYAPDTIPEEFRQPWERRGMHLGQSELAKGPTGLNPTMCNAVHEGGPRNGVMTGLEDWMAEHPEPLRLVVLPIYFGLAIVVEQRRLERQPALARELDRIESLSGKQDLLELGEQLRLRSMVFQHNVYYPSIEREERLVNRYLDTVKAAVLDEHYLENESRIAHLESRIRSGRAPEPRVLRDPVRHDTDTWKRLHRERTGAAGPDDRRGRSFLPYTDMGRFRLDLLHRCLDDVRTGDVAGDLVECGVGRGGGGIFMRAWLAAHDITNRKVWMVDPFRAAPEGQKSPSMPDTGTAGFRADLNLVRDGFDRFDLLDDRVRFVVGDIGDGLTDASIVKVAVLRIGPDAGMAARQALRHLYGRVSVGGYVVVEAERGSDTRNAVESFRRDRDIAAPAERDDHGLLVWRKAEGESEKARYVVPARSGLARAPLAPPLAEGSIDLTVVVAFYNMRREAERTLHSLSRSYQEGVDGIEYEVLVVDNGSAPDQAITQDFVAGFGREFRLVTIDQPHPSPVMALNQGIREGRGRNYALMIDGAHVLSPGIVRFGLAGLSTYEPAIVATQQWYVGPGQQGDAMLDGYDQRYEDKLFETIGWPSNGYRLFEISHFIGDRDWLDGLWESNCIFVGRKTLEQVGGFDESFDVPGAGYANLELYERLGSSPDITVATILGEGSFHQIHGGDTTNQIDPAERRARVFGYSQDYAELRGRAFRGPGKPIHYVGTITSPSARRTRARRITAEAFSAAPVGSGVDGPATEPTPMADELGIAFTEAVYGTMPWTKTSWLGRPIRSAPTDLLAYQELISRIRPDFVVETGASDPGRSLYLASICQIIGSGHVVVVGPADVEVPDHPRIIRVDGVPHLEETAAEVRKVVGQGSSLVILGSVADRFKTSEEFERYAPLVGVGSYVIVTDTVVNGHPVWPGFGPGPAEAVKQILARNGSFSVDPDLVKYSLSWNPGGYLRRVG